jgi:hypothetical protein
MDSLLVARFPTYLHDAILSAPAPPPRPYSPTSQKRISRNFAKNNALKGTKFIANSSPFASVISLCNTAGLTSPAFYRRRLPI